MIVWDTGTYENITEQDGKTVPAGDALENGHLLVYLHGKKIRGGYVLQRMGDDEGSDWLLIKMADDEADARRNPISTQPKSVLSGRTIEEVAKAERARD